MKFKLKFEGDTLHLTISGVENTPDARGRVCNMELHLLHYYGTHKSLPVQTDGEGKLVFQFIRGDSTHEMYMGARKTLEGFAVIWINGRDGIQPGDSGFVEWEWAAAGIRWAMANPDTLCTLSRGDMFNAVQEYVAPLVAKLDTVKAALAGNAAYEAAWKARLLVNESSN